MKLSKIGHDLTAITMGIDRFERVTNDGRSLLDGEGLVPVYLGEDLVVPRAYTEWDEIRDDLSQIDAMVAALKPGERRVFLEGMVRSLKMAVRVFSGGSPTFEEKVLSLVGAPLIREDVEMVEVTRDRIDRLLKGLGFNFGSLRDRVRAWEEDRAIAPDRIEPIFKALMDEAKRRTADMIFDTGDFDLALNAVHDKPYAARWNFNEGQIDLNVDITYTCASLKHLVCHEAFPGHSTHLLYTRAEVDAGRSTLDSLLITANAITGCVQEGIADQGIHLIDWLEDDDDQLSLELRNLRSAAQFTAIWAYMAQGQSAEQTIKYLRNIALGQDAWVRGRLRTAAHPFKGPFIASYWAGNEAVRRVRERVTNAQRPDFLRALFGRAQSPQSLEMFPIA